MISFTFKGAIILVLITKINTFVLKGILNNFFTVPCNKIKIVDVNVCPKLVKYFEYEIMFSAECNQTRITTSPKSETLKT